MKCLPRLFAALAVVATMLAFVSIRPVQADSCVIFSYTNSTSSDISLDSSHGWVGLPFHSYLFTQTSSINAYNYSFPIAANSGVTHNSIGINQHSTATITDLDCTTGSGSGSGSQTFFNPGDGRVNGEPGDRLVVYCNASATPPNVDVWVIDNASIGHELSKLPLSALTSAADGKFSKNLGADGVLFAGSDASGNSYAALQGGPYNGTAMGDWLKTFSCTAS